MSRALERIGKRIVQIYGELMGAGARAMRAMFMSRVGDPPVRSTAELLEIYETSPWVRAVHGRISSSIGETQWILRRSDQPNAAPITDNLLLYVLQHPNPLMSGAELFKITQLCLDLVGDSFWLKARNGLGAPVQLLPIPPHWVAELPTPATGAFRVSFGSWQESIPDSEIVWFHDPAPANPYRRGSGIVRAQADEIETHEFASKHAKQLFFNRATPEYVVMDEGAGKEEVEIHERAWLQRLQGYWRWQKPYFTNRKLEFWQPTQMNLDNLTMVPLMKYERDVILQSTGVPPEQLGIVENSNRATIDGSNYVYESRIVRPRRVFLRDAMQLRLIPEYDERIRLDFVDTIPADNEQRLQTAARAPHVPTVDEWRDWMGLPALGGELGKAHLMTMNTFLAVDPLDPAARPQTGGGAAPGRRAEDQPGADKPPAAPPPGN
jgi:Phage portal protein